MKTILMAALAVFALAGLQQRPVAASDRAWCEYGSSTSPDCSFYSYAQCMQTARGDGDHCELNPELAGRYLNGQSFPVEREPNGRH